MAAQLPSQQPRVVLVNGGSNQGTHCADKTGWGGFARDLGPGVIGGLTATAGEDLYNALKKVIVDAVTSPSTPQPKKP